MNKLNVPKEDIKQTDQTLLMKMDLILKSENQFKVLILKLITYLITLKGQALKYHHQVTLNQIK